jgi:hypothetical protein
MLLSSPPGKGQHIAVKLSRVSAGSLSHGGDLD